MDVQLRREIARFIIVGGIAVAIDGLVYAILYRVVGWDASWAKRVSFATGSAWAFFANKFFTFGSQTWTPTEPVLFVLVYSVGWVANSLTHDLIMRLTALNWLSFLGATSASTITNFAGVKCVVFRRSEVKETS